MSAKRLLRSFQYAGRGLLTVAREEQNFRVQLLAAAVVWILAAVLRIRPIEAAVLALVTGLVLVLELLNSLLERVVDALKPRLHPYAAEVKNIAAGAVLISSVAALAVSFFVFVPYFFR